MASNEKILDQLDSDANVINYQPDLKYKKPRTARGDGSAAGQDENYDPDKDTTLYTKTLNGFAENTPSSVLNDIDYVLKNVNRLKNNLAERFNEDQAMIDNPFYNEINDDDIEYKNYPTIITGGINSPGPGPTVTDQSTIDDDDDDDDYNGNGDGRINPPGPNPRIEDPLIRDGYDPVPPSPTDRRPNGVVTGGSIITGTRDGDPRDTNDSNWRVKQIGANTKRGYDSYGDIGQLIKAGETGNNDFAKEFADKYNDVYGSVIPSLINQLANIENKLKELDREMKDHYYGKPDITLDQAKEIDESYVKDMKLRERNGDKSTINYLTTSFDSLLNKIVSYCVYQDNKSAIKVAKVIDSHEEVKATSNDMDIVHKMFDDIEKELDIRARGYMRNEDLELIQKSLYNYYEKRKYLNDAYSLYKNNEESTFLGRKVQEYSRELDEAVRNVGRVLMYNQNYLNQITSLENQKYNLQKISRSTSSNS